MAEYIPEQYWKEKGKQPVEIRSKEQLDEILFILKNIKFKTVFEPGCGDGQITKLILDNFKIKQYDLCELSLDRAIKFNKRIGSLKKYGAKGHFHIGEFQDCDKIKKYDLVICASFLLHIKPEDICKVIKKMEKFSRRYIVAIEPNPLEDLGEWKYYNFKYDYFKLFEQRMLNVEFFRLNKNVGLFLIDKKPSDAYRHEH